MSGALVTAASKAEHTAAVKTMYRRLMKKRLEHTMMGRSHWHEWCYYVRERIESRRHETNPGRINEFMQEGQDYLNRLTDAKPYRLPWTKFSSMWQRNVPTHPIFLLRPECIYEGDDWGLELDTSKGYDIWITKDAEYHEKEFGRPDGVYDMMRVPQKEDNGAFNPMYTPTKDMEAKDFPCWRDHSLSDKQPKQEAAPAAKAAHSH
eukprot:gb/GEZN01014017.1/.p1 GENE.gb/GEZN01014017.1/~~gb/GEZN01014017.1/.p1  ORF type:complete len:206 (+),score=30.10 gb/GEZN01014017.1/:116-733(+)